MSDNGEEQLVGIIEANQITIKITERLMATKTTRANKPINTTACDLFLIIATNPTGCYQWVHKSYICKSFHL